MKEHKQLNDVLSVVKNMIMINVKMMMMVLIIFFSSFTRNVKLNDII